MKNTINLTILAALGLFIVLGCGSTANKTSTNTVSLNTGDSINSSAPSAPAATSEKPIAIQAKAFTKEYEENELAADKKYKGKMIAVTGKISNIAETMGNVTVQLDGHNIAKNVMCNFEASESDNVAKLKKGQQVTLVGKGDGVTMGLYAGLENCKIQ